MPSGQPGSPNNNEVDGVGVSHITADLPAGTYTVLAAAPSGAGGYQLLGRLTPHDMAPCEHRQRSRLDSFGGFIQRLGRAQLLADINGQPVDYYTFTLSARFTFVLAVMTSGEVDGFLTLVDAAGTSCAPTTTATARTIFADRPATLPAGTYQLAARDASSTPGGLYEIDLRTTPGPRPPFCNPITQLNAPATVNGVIMYTGCQYIDSTFADFYQITLPADATVDIRANSTEFDAYLILLDSKGAEIDEDDDSGGNTNARLNRPLPAGTYTIVVEPFGDYTAHGKYTLTVN